MLYKLDTIPLALFIDIYLGDTGKAVKEGKHTEEEARDAAAAMIHEYMSIVGGKSLSSLLVKRNDLLKLSMRGTCLEICKRLAKAGETENACKILQTLGYKVKPDRDAIMKKVESLTASDKYRMEKLSAAKEGESMTRDHFIKERVAVMSHLKMHIDEHSFTAKEYAYLVKQVSDEIDSMIRATKKK